MSDRGMNVDAPRSLICSVAQVQVRRRHWDDAADIRWLVGNCLAKRLELFERHCAKDRRRRLYDGDGDTEEMSMLIYIHYVPNGYATVSCND